MQWAEVIVKDFKNLNLIIGFEEMLSKSKFALRWVKGFAMREYEIGKLNNLKYWLSYLKYIFDQDNSKALFIIILLIYDTLSERIIKTTFKENSENSKIKKKIFSNR
jgi:hypothetical protein